MLDETPSLVGVEDKDGNEIQQAMEDKDMINAVEGFTITNMFPLLGSALS